MKKQLFRFLFILLICSTFSITNTKAQKISNEEISLRIASYKADVRGPYKDIRWFCPDGSFKSPQERCTEPGGVQRARYKDEIISLANSNHVFLGQILSTTPYADFWDESNNYSRIKQFQIEKYLIGVDKGWILRKAQYYRGAFQAEDEELWGLGFFNWLLADDAAIQTQFFLIRQACKDIPHNNDDNTKQKIRLNSKLISDSYPPFLDIRVKIHGQPDKSDIQKTKDFRRSHQEKMAAPDLKMMDDLITDLEKQYKAFDIQSLDRLIMKLPGGSSLRETLLHFQSNFKSSKNGFERIQLLSEILEKLRASILSVKTSSARLAVMDISIILEDLLFREAGEYKPATIKESLLYINQLGRASAGCGYLEVWEWKHLQKFLYDGSYDKMKQAEFMKLFESCRNIVEWGSSMFMAVYEDDIKLYSGFEPKTEGFLDDKIRSSILLQVGIQVSSLGDIMARYLPAGNRILDIAGQTSARGLNPGFAKGELVVVQGSIDDLVVEKDKIYIFNKPPSDLKPVAGIMTVSEGNPVSHVQLLARNLGIPNAVISMQNLDELKKYSGQHVFYAVSSKGVIVMKREKDMNEEEAKLFTKKERSENKISVPVEKIRLDNMRVLNLREVDASSSGIWCGPKAANLGQLKKLFPDNVVEGLVIPFGIFMQHMQIAMPGQQMTYWEYLQNIFEQSRMMRLSGVPEAEIESFELGELGIFREAIGRISLSKELIAELNQLFVTVFGKKMGEIPVFLRSDTNMEDLKDFTGAGLNLTLFNVISADAILKGIRDVWASPYTERSYKWRQRYLLNPENVFPSILIIPSVNVDYSGVLITKGISSGLMEDATAAFSRGAGGAVDGQAAETYLLKKAGKDILLLPAREPSYISLPASGGVKKEFTSFERGVLNDQNIASLREIGREIRNRLPGFGSKGPFDIELGFKDNKLWLFQVRPFVENKNAIGQIYLESLNPILNDKMIIELMHTIQ